MGKSSVEWQELHGLRTYVQHLKSIKVMDAIMTTKLVDINVAISMADERIRELEDKGV